MLMEIKKIPLYKQIYIKIREDILNGYLKKGDQLPSIRCCQHMMKVSKTSVEHAYQQLVEEGYICSRPQSGYFVDVDYEHVQMRKLLLSDCRKEEKKILYDFRSQSVDEDAFDIRIWNKYLKETLEQQDKISTYGDPQGELLLRMALQRYAYFNRGVLCDVNDIVVGASFQVLLFLLCGLFSFQPIVGMEKGSFTHARRVFESYHFPIVELDLHEDGINIEELEQKHVQLLYIYSGSQGKNYKPLTKEKNQLLLKWVQEKNAYIIEDDHNGELRYVEHKVNSIQGMDSGSHIFYIGSFSRLLLPSLRISYLVFPKTWTNQYQLYKESYAPTSSKIEQLALARYMTDGHLERHVKKLKKKYKQKSMDMKIILKKYFPNTEIILEEASLQYIIRFPYMLDLVSLLHYLNDRGVAINVKSQNELVVSFAAISSKKMEQGVFLISQAINENEVFK